MDESGEVTSAGCTDPEHLNGVFCARHPQIEALISEGCPTTTTVAVTTTAFPIPTTKPPTEGFCIANRLVYV